jgi:hypothetical protein
VIQIVGDVQNVEHVMGKYIISASGPTSTVRSKEGH